MRYAPVKDPQPSSLFPSSQRNLILQYNMWLNGGTLRSDDPHDPFPLLDEGGGDDAPELDHISPRSRGGSNAFTNARVVSWLVNNSLDRISGEPNTTTHTKALKKTEKHLKGKSFQPMDDIAAAVCKAHGFKKNDVLKALYWGARKGIFVRNPVTEPEPKYKLHSQATQNPTTGSTARPKSERIKNQNQNRN